MILTHEPADGGGPSLTAKLTPEQRLAAEPAKGNRGAPSADLPRVEHGDRYPGDRYRGQDVPPCCYGLLHRIGETTTEMLDYVLGM